MPPHPPGKRTRISAPASYRAGGPGPSEGRAFSDAAADFGVSDEVESLSDDVRGRVS